MSKSPRYAAHDEWGKDLSMSEETGSQSRAGPGRPERVPKLLRDAHNSTEANLEFSHMDYRSPGSVREAVELLSAHNGAAHLLAGGTDLLVKLRGGFVTPEVVVDLKAIPELRRIEGDTRGFRIGAAASCAEIGEHAALVAAWPGVVEALHLIGLPFDVTGVLGFQNHLFDDVGTGVPFAQ